MEKILPPNMHQSEDIETLLGVSVGVEKEQLLMHLNKEYRKWNSRVTNADPKIQAQADYMLKLIAQARSDCTISAKN